MALANLTKQQRAMLAAVLRAGEVRAGRSDASPQRYWRIPPRERDPGETFSFVTGSTLQARGLIMSHPVATERTIRGEPMGAYRYSRTIGYRYVPTLKARALMPEIVPYDDAYPPVDFDAIKAQSDKREQEREAAGPSSFTVTIRLDNAAFADGRKASETARILRDLAKQIANNDELPKYQAVFDENGNSCGHSESE